MILLILKGKYTGKESNEINKKLHSILNQSCMKMMMKIKGLLCDIQRRQSLYPLGFPAHLYGLIDIEMNHR